MKARSDCGSLTSAFKEEDKDDKRVELLLNLSAAAAVSSRAVGISALKEVRHTLWLQSQLNTTNTASWPS